MSNHRMNPSEAPAAEDELRVVRRAQHGDRSALEELARHWRPRLVHLLVRKTGSPDDAEDIAQQTLMRAIERIVQHDGRRRFAVWLYRIAWRAAADYHRKSRPEPGLDGGRVCDSRASDPQEAAVAVELRKNLWSVARRVLSAEQYSALWLRYAEDMSIKDVASVLCRTRISTRVLLHRARQRLAPHVRRLADADQTHPSADAPVSEACRR
jgi:RNA polymerase sigma-70 factor (ECF subfamily)